MHDEERVRFDLGGSRTVVRVGGSEAPCLGAVVVVTDPLVRYVPSGEKI